MNEPSTGPTAPDGTTNDDSFGRMLALWVLVGFPLISVGLSLAGAIPTRFGFSEMEVGFLLGSVAFCALWLGGFRPSLRVAVVFLFVEQFVSLVVVLSAAIVVAGRLGDLQTAGLRSVAVVLAAWLVFGGVGRRGAEWAYRRLRRQLGVPTDEPRERR
ncbi:hypothetical protein [Halomarina rubra]|uniref:Uncharacterized protein n=1 Tax=Halomarina rubra TaxID=2071873 RepID=A0ABD6AT96_9EURY|nr:hypothetical protein [Halomarina rubra]